MAENKVPLDEVLSKIGIGWFQLRLWWISGFGFSAAAVEVVLMSFVFPELRKSPWLLDEYELATLSTVMSCGSIFGTLIFGMLADQFGRKGVFMATVVVVVIFGIASAFAPTVGWLAFLRFLVGFGYGGNIAVDFTLYSEFLPTEGRGKMLFLLTGFWPLGQIFACLLAWAVIPQYGWQLYVALCAIPSFITACARPFIPESPRWLLTQGRGEEATQICLEMAEMNGKSANSVGLVHLCEVCLENENSPLGDAEKEAEQPATWSRLLVFFNASQWKTTVGLLITVSALNYTGYGTLTLMPSFLKMKGIPTPNMYRSMVLNASAQIPGVILATVCASYIGRLNPLRASIFLTGLALFGFAFTNQEMHVIVCTMCANVFLEAGWALYHVYVPEVYSTDCRAFATGFLSAAGSVVAMGGPMISAALMTTQNIFNVILVFSSVSMFAGMCACILLHIETKDRDLCDVTEALKSKSLADSGKTGENSEGVLSHVFNIGSA